MSLEALKTTRSSEKIAYVASQYPIVLCGFYVGVDQTETDRVNRVCLGHFGIAFVARTSFYEFNIFSVNVSFNFFY